MSARMRSDNRGSIRGSPPHSARVTQNPDEGAGTYRSREIVWLLVPREQKRERGLLLRKSGFNAGNLRGGMGEWNFARGGAASQP